MSQSSATPPAGGAADAVARPSGLYFGLGMLLLLAAFASSSAMVASQMIEIDLPGCAGLHNPCAAAGASFWGRVPGLDWPASYVGWAFFAALIVCWLDSHGRLSGSLRNAVRVGGLVSVGYLAVMYAQKFTCPYCIGVHAANLAFVGLVELARYAPQRRKLTLGVATAAASGLLLAYIDLGIDKTGRGLGAAAAEGKPRPAHIEEQRGFQSDAAPAAVPDTQPTTTAPSAEPTTTAPSESAVGGTATEE